MAIEITWLGHASVLIRADSTVIYIDPWKVTGAFPKADLILLTHDHYDHYSEDDIVMLSSQSTRVVAPMKTPLVSDTIAVGDNLSMSTCSVQAVASYNIEKEFHPKEKGWVGYVVAIGTKKIYHAGDTDRIPEMKDIRVDLVLLPVGGTYTMDADAAREAIKDIEPLHVIPIHFGDIVGSRHDAEALLDVENSKIHILNPGEIFMLE
ncbi:MAG: MBL fold metallo-hydrolase [Deltaproteobacteria bacterium]|nr:MBL fold metallo-hydrolase [Deltaproteobacteria bacterium]